jgi:hypothetical protein
METFKIMNYKTLTELIVSKSIRQFNRKLQWYLDAGYTVQGNHSVTKSHYGHIYSVMVIKIVAIPTDSAPSNKN